MHALATHVWVLGLSLTCWQMQLASLIAHVELSIPCATQGIYQDVSRHRWVWTICWLPTAQAGIDSPSAGSAAAAAAAAAVAAANEQMTDAKSTNAVGALMIASSGGEILFDLTFAVSSRVYAKFLGVVKGWVARPAARAY